MKIFIETLGCPKNFNDSQVAAGILESEGITVTENIEEADAVMVNTCGFINDAKQESIMKIFELAQFEDKLLIVSGCLSQRYSEELFEEMPEVDIFIGVNEYDKLPDIIKQHEKEVREKIVNDYEYEIETDKRKLEKQHYQATIKISEGCDNKCAYCIIPFIRGKYRSRKMENILSEAKRLAENGVKELILIGQDVTNYGIDLYGEYKLANLVEELGKIEKLHWIRLMYCYEDRITDELIDVMARNEKVCNYIDIPIQHYSDNVLKLMNRRSSSKSIDETLGKLKEKISDIRIRTTLITGFPGETDEDFDRLYNFVEKTKFGRLGVFTYSQEEGTVAAEMENQIDEDVKEERKDAIMRLQMLISREMNESMIGEKVEVLIEEEDSEGVYIGRTQYDAPEIDNQVIVKCERKHNPGDFIMAEIYDAYDYDILGREIIEDEFTK